MNTRPESTPTTGTATVTVACKIPNGLILELGSPGVAGYWRQIINGSNHDSAVCGFGFTPSVDEAAFAQWLKVNANLEFVRQKLIFAHENASYAQARAIDHAELKSGLEALNPNKDLPKGVTPMNEAA